MLSMMDAGGPSGGDTIRLEVESLPRNVERLTQEVREVKTALFKLRASAVKSGDEETGETSWGRQEDESP